MAIGSVQSTGFNKNFMGKFASLKPVKYLVNEFGKNEPVETIVSVVSKDFVGALVLFYQTYHNKRIPEKKRKYLASYELTSGSYNVLFPITAGLFITSVAFKHKTAKMLFKKYYVKPEVLDKAKVEAKKALGIAQEQAKKIIASHETFEKCNKGLAALVNLIFITIISKRVICPFVGGPLATVFNKYVLQKHEGDI